MLKLQIALEKAVDVFEYILKFVFVLVFLVLVFPFLLMLRSIYEDE